MNMPARKWNPVILFYALALLTIGAVNPLTIKALLGGEAIIGPKIKILIALFDVYLLLLPTLFLIFRGRPKIQNHTVNQAILLGAVLMVLTTAKVADLALGYWRHNWDLIFVPHSSARYVTGEFDYTAKINRYGFRGLEDMEAPKAEDFNILMVGDSFTFGWGLADEKNWPALVEAQLQSSDPRVRVFNLGKPGSSPAAYCELVKRASGLLKSDLIVLNLVQGDDLFQLAPGGIEGMVHHASRGGAVGQWQQLRTRFRQFLPNLSGALFGGGAFGSSTLEADIASDWVKQAETIYQDLSRAQKGRFESLSDTTRTLFFRGQLNPKLVLDGVVAPRRFAFYEDLEAPATQAAIRVLQDQFDEIHEMAWRCHSDLLVSLIPDAPYVSAANHRIWKGMGYELDDRLLQSRSSEAAVAEAAQAAGLDFYSPLEEFRQAAATQPLYYEYDGHFNPAGAELYAQYLTRLVQSRMTAGTFKSSAPRP